jgi:hypothetical protein
MHAPVSQKGFADVVPKNPRGLVLMGDCDWRYPQAIAYRERIPVGTMLSRIFTAKRLLQEAWD